MSDSNRVGIRAVVESTWGETPATPTMQAWRFTGSDTMKLEKASETSEEIREDAQISDTVDVGYNGQGGFAFELSYSTFDDLFEGILRNPWSSDIGFTGNTVDADPIDNSLNDSLSGFPIIEVGRWIKTSGFVFFQGANNGYARVVSSTASKIILNPDDLTLQFEAAGENVSITGSMIRNGITVKSWTIEKAMLDVSQFFNFPGMSPNTGNLSFAARAKVTGNVDFIGKDANRTTSTIADTVTPVTTTRIMNATSNVDFFKEGGTPEGKVMQFNVDWANNIAGRPVVADPAFESLRYGSFNATGQLEVYFEDGALWDKYKAGDRTSVAFQVTDNAGNSYIFTTPSIHLTNSDILAGSINSDVMASYDYEANVDPVTGCMFQIDRFPAS